MVDRTLPQEAALARALEYWRDSADEGSHDDMRRVLRHHVDNPLGVVKLAIDLAEEPRPPFGALDLSQAAHLAMELVTCRLAPVEDPLLYGAQAVLSRCTGPYATWRDAALAGIDRLGGAQALRIPQWIMDGLADPQLGHLLGADTQGFLGNVCNPRDGRSAVVWHRVNQVGYVLHSAQPVGL